ncbi:MAG: cyclopropane-fatty-acyl-phospholipid synthase family protein [Acidobacteriota bacterium]
MAAERVRREPRRWFGDRLVRSCRNRLFELLEGLEGGRLVVEDADGAYCFGPAQSDLMARVRVRDPAFYLAVARRGSVGAGEAFMDGLWSCDRLTDLVRIFARDRERLNSVDSLQPWTDWLLRWEYRRRRNTKEGSRRNIRDHYDLGNAFFSLFLDSTMMYSAAYFPKESSSLEEASVAKVEKICRKLDLRPSDHLVEIGSGWGFFAVYAAQNYGCRVTTTTISEEQYRETVRRVAAAGLEERVRVLRQDYRDLEGRYDKLASIEMIEAVGYDFLDAYFRKCDALLKPGGRALLQVITIADELLDQARRSVDFIKKYIFPGSALPALGQIRSITERSTRLRILDLEDLTLHYARTLAAWRSRFLANQDAVRQLGYPERFLRMWEFYLHYCEGGFLERHIGDYQILFVKEAAAGASR